jgi:hypothetical protein
MMLVTNILAILLFCLGFIALRCNKIYALMNYFCAVYLLIHVLIPILVYLD